MKVHRLPWVAPVVRAPDKYDHIDMTPTKGMKTAAERGKRLRKKHGRGGTHEGARTATAILSGKALGPVLVRKMHRYFTRFAGLTEEQRGTEKWNPTSDKVSNHRIAWDLWGNDPGAAWARQRVRQLDAADDEASKRAIRRGVCLPWQRAARAFSPPRSERSRAAYWRGWLDSIQGPTERKLLQAWRVSLRKAADRYAHRAGVVLGDRRAVAGLVLHKAQISRAEMDQILDSAGEIQALKEGVPESTVRRAMQLAFARAAGQIGIDAEWDPTLDPTTEVIADMVTFVEQTTKDKIAKLVRQSLANGVQVNELQGLIQNDVVFSPRRALRVSRTETAKVLSKGARLAYEDASRQGVSFRIEWLTARDENVRADHKALEGQQVEPGQPFIVPDAGATGANGEPQQYVGESGDGPGEFSSAGMVVNCRCTTIPVLT